MSFLNEVLLPKIWKELNRESFTRCHEVMKVYFLLVEKKFNEMRLDVLNLFSEYNVYRLLTKMKQPATIKTHVDRGFFHFCCNFGCNKQS